MNVTLRIAPRADARAALAADPELSRSLDVSAIVIELDAGDPRFHRIIERTTETSGCWLNPIMHFTPAEMAEARCFQLECRGRIVRETPRDYEHNRARLDATELHRLDGRPSRIKLVDGLAFSRIALPPNAVGCASDWMAEFIVPAGVSEAFKEASLSGYTLRPLRDPAAGHDHPGYFQLYSESILPPAERDATTVPQEAQDGGGWRELGCLSYRFDGHDVNDFNRTAEDWSNNSLPLWVASARVRQCMLAKKLKGWAFRPVLEIGTPLHDTYTALWSALLERVAVNPGNRF